ncbi:hypothetical protein HS125_08955 [bacterium]|nr:hypothetical protein [bacterium]
MTPVLAQTPTPIIPQAQLTQFTNARKIVLYQHYAYLADQSQGIAVVDIADPSAPRFLRFAPIPAGEQGGGWIGDLAAGDGYLVASNDVRERLYFYSLADPERPVVVGPGRGSSVYPHSGLIIRNGRLWVSGGDRRLEVYDLTNLNATPRIYLLSQFDANLAFDIAQSPNGAFLSGRRFDGNYAVIALNDANYPDLASPAWESVAFSVNPVSSYTLRCAWRNNHLFAASSSFLNIMAATEPRLLRRVNSVSVGRQLLDVALSEEGYAVVSHVLSSGLSLIDVRDPAGNIPGLPNPAVVRRLIPNPGGGTVLPSLAIRGRTLFAAGSEVAGLQVYDLGPHSSAGHLTMRRPPSPHADAHSHADAHAGQRRPEPRRRGG